MRLLSKGSYKEFIRHNSTLISCKFQYKGTFLEKKYQLKIGEFQS